MKYNVQNDDLNIIKILIEDGRYFFMGKYPSYKNPFENNKWIINDVSFHLSNNKETFLYVDIYYKNKNIPKGMNPHKNGYLYHTSRTIKYSDLMFLKRINKIKKICSKLEIR